MENIKAWIMWGLSFLKEDWNLPDYPLSYKKKDHAGESVPKYCVQIINWWQISGVGNTKQEAKDDLHRIFSELKANIDQLPRPGTGLPIEFALTHELEKYWGVASRLIQEVLGYDIDEVFVSDESSLWDFPRGDNKHYYLNKIIEIFHEDVSHIENGRLSDISKYIYEKRQ